MVVSRPEGALYRGRSSRGGYGGGNILKTNQLIRLGA